MITTNSINLDYEQLLNHSLNAIFVLSKNNIIYANQAALNLVAVKNYTDIIDVEFPTFLHPDYYMISKERLQNVREQLRTAELMEQKIIQSDGTIIDIEVTAAPYIFKSEVLVQVIIRDISLRKKMERRLSNAEKLSAIGELSAGIAHEIKNPLTAIKGFIQLLTETNCHPYLDIISTELENALSTLTNLLQVARPDFDHEPKVKINLCSELEQLLLLFQNEIDRVNIKTRFYNREASIMGKKNLLLKAFFNLLKNAFEAIAGKGKLMIEHCIKNDFVHIKITDTGVGIPEKDIKKLGNPFFSTKCDGTGMGLTQAFNTIHNHGGIIDIQSEMGKGTTFWIQLPKQKGSI